MEKNSTKVVRVFRGKAKILTLLEEFGKSDMSIEAFCTANSIASTSFHKWKKKYGVPKVKPKEERGFTPLRITPVAPAEEVSLFAAVNGIRIYQLVPAAYLKELLP